MASCPAPNNGCRGCMGELAHLAIYAGTEIMPDCKKIMPQPQWCQEAAMVGWKLDRLTDVIAKFMAEPSEAPKGP